MRFEWAQDNLSKKMNNIMKKRIVLLDCENLFRVTLLEPNHKQDKPGCIRKQTIILLVFFSLSFSLPLPAQWVWQNPKPTGNDILNVKFIDENTGWFVGNYGTIFKTTDGGLTWFTQNTKYTCDFTAIDPVDANNIWVIGYGYDTVYVENDPSFKILFSADGGKHWDLKLSGAKYFCDSTCRKFGYIEDIDFIDETTGYVVGDSGLILKTTNAGTSWELQEQSKDYNFKSVQFFDPIKGYVAGGGGYITIGHVPRRDNFDEHGAILKTTDGGLHWQTVYSDTFTFFDIYFRNPQLGWAVGEARWLIGYGEIGGYQTLLKTTDGGENWTKLMERDTINPLALNIYFINDSVGWMVGSGGGFMKTTDGGYTWALSFPSQHFLQHLVDVFAFDTSHIITVGDYHTILQTSDGGNNWCHRDTSSLLNASIRDIRFLNPDTGVIIQSYLWRTTDKGQHWNWIGIGGLWALDCNGDKDCWTVGYGGRILHSSDAGNSWVDQNSGITEWIQAVKFVSTKIGWAAGEYTILKTTDGGNTWFTQYVNQSQSNYYAITTQDSNRLWIYAYIGATLRTMNGGITWYDCSSSLDSMCAIYFINPDTGWVRKNVTLYRTFNGGTTWEEIGERIIPNTKTQFVDVNNGWFFDSYSVSRTTNGGYDWWPEVRVRVVRSIYSLHFIDSSHGWCGTMDGGLIRYGYPELITNVVQEHSSVLLPNEIKLLPNYPNPFNSGTFIHYEIKTKSKITITIYDLLGREVRLLDSNEKEPGNYTTIWDGKNNNGSETASGVYICRMYVEPSPSALHKSLIQSQKLLLIK